jgi:hypothetical protein
MFFYHLNSVVRFKNGKQDILWEQLLGRAWQSYNNYLYEIWCFLYKSLETTMFVSKLKCIIIIK